MSAVPDPAWKSALTAIAREAGLHALRGITAGMVTPHVAAFFTDLARDLYREAAARRGLRVGWDGITRAEQEEWVAVARDATRVLFERLRK